MIFVFFIGLFFLFLLLGAVVFIASFPLHLTRRYALSAALWCAAWGPCIIGFLAAFIGTAMLAGLIASTNDTLTSHLDRVFSALGWGYLTVGLLLTLVLTTAAALLHQAIIDRLPAMLFRVYAAVVTAGIGSVFGWSLYLWQMTLTGNGVLHFIGWLLAMVALVVGFGAAGFRQAGGMRVVA